MIEQPDITGTVHTIGATGKPLTEKQQRGYDLARSTPGGVTADEFGALEHARRGKHHPDSRCEFCTSEGMGVLDSKAVGPLVVRRRASGRYEPRDGNATPAVPDGTEGSQAPSSQVSELPGGTFEDMFSARSSEEAA